MALDDVVVRAMSKSPNDRYPSAGDLGRAAQAALAGEQPTVPERTVATGAAATKTTQAMAVENEEARGRRLWAIAAGAAAVVAAVAVVIVIASGGGGSRPNVLGETESAATGGSAPKPTLNKAELIAKADAICAVSKSTYLGVRSQAKEESPDVAYAATLAGISQRGVNGFRRLVPPPALEPAFKQYLTAQERVMRYDREALKAAEANDVARYVAARQRRDAEAAERYELARKIGLKKCSTNRG